MGFPCGSAGEESACNEGNLGLIPGLGRAPGERKGFPLQYSGLENSMDSIVHGVAKSRTQLSDFHCNKFTSNTVFSFILQYVLLSTYYLPLFPPLLFYCFCLFVFHIDGSLDHITALKRTHILSGVELAFCTYRILKHTQYILKNHSDLWNVKRNTFLTYVIAITSPPNVILCI